MELNKANALVTGASIGIGRAIAQAVAAKGARVGLVGRNAAALNETKDTIIESGGKAEVFTADLRDTEAMDAMAERVLSEWGAVDILANIAGAWHDAEKTFFGPLQERSVAEIDEALEVNLRAPLLLSRKFIPAMIEKRAGKIINLSGVFPEFGYKHVPYYVTKTAVETLTVGLATELRQHNIQVNCLSPGEVDTKAVRQFFPQYVDHAIDPDVVADVALMLLEQKSSDFITGQVIVIGYDGTFWNWDEFA